MDALIIGILLFFRSYIDRKLFIGIPLFSNSYRDRKLVKMLSLVNKYFSQRWWYINLFDMEEDTRLEIKPFIIGGEIHLGCKLIFYRRKIDSIVSFNARVRVEGGEVRVAIEDQLVNKYKVFIDKGLYELGKRLKEDIGLNLKCI